jgi:hypothetical protein
MENFSWNPPFTFTSKVKIGGELFHAEKINLRRAQEAAREHSLGGE